MPSQAVFERIYWVTEALKEKGFEDLYATHYDNTPPSLIVLHDDHGRVAHGEDEALKRIIEEADDVSGLWSSLEDAGMIRTATAKRD